MTSFDSLAAVLPTRDVNAALHRYQRLGFDVSPFRDGSEYGYARRDNVNLHLAQVDDLDPSASLVATYLYVGHADDVHAEWTDAGVEGRLVAPRRHRVRRARGRIRRSRRQPAALRITHPRDRQRLGIDVLITATKRQPEVDRAATGGVVAVPTRESP